MRKLLLLALLPLIILLTLSVRAGQNDASRGLKNESLPAESDGGGDTPGETAEPEKEAEPAGPEPTLPDIEAPEEAGTNGRAADKIALVIGNNEYTASESIPPLENAVNDADAMAASLLKLGFDVMLKHDLSREDTIGALNEFYKKIAAGAKVAFFYYSGHGMQYRGINYLIPVSSVIERYDQIRTDGVSFQELVARLEKAEAGTSILIFDACRSVPRLLASDGLEESLDTGLAQFSVNTASFIAFSTSPGEAAFDGVGDNSPFTSGLLRWIDEPGLTIEQVFKHVRRDVMRNTDNAQRPWDLSSLTDEFYFIPPEKSEEPAEAGEFDKAYAYFNIGLEQSDEGRTEDAISSFTKVIEISPGYAEAYKERGTLYIKQKNPDESIRDLNKAVELNPEFAAAYNNRGIVYSIEGDYDKALENFDKALEIDRGFLKSYNNKAYVLQILGKQEEALEIYSKALEINPAYSPVYNNRGLLYFRNEEYGKAAS